MPIFKQKAATVETPAPAPTSNTIRVVCIQSRRVADDIYVAGEEYDMAKERAKRYREYFRPAATVETAPPVVENPEPVTYRCSQCNRVHKSDSRIGAHHKDFAVVA